MKLEKIERKWVVRGSGEGWIFKKRFPAKWKALKAIEVFERGGKVSDYWKAIREEHPPKRIPHKALAEVEHAFDEIKALDPTCEEIEEFAEPPVYGVVTRSRSEAYFGPYLHDTWGEKSGGRVHIDIGCCGYHLMLDKYSAWAFIEFVKEKRSLARP